MNTPTFYAQGLLSQLSEESHFGSNALEELSYTSKIFCANSSTYKI